ncbi:hypothetical protein R3Q06_34480 [Rhodococcus erythropolis]|uniref:hypothetical protein n=1 Tax=Rhodococcus erythropolis TaxID=1833 RepID=UPI0029490614|nr:hypothetical protein [Rhodococcus erythropolis]MDV6278512.1 hypothetical protein [Rhodococcus erythropolis]
MKNASIPPLPAAVTGNLTHPATRGAALGRACTEPQALAIDAAGGSAVTGVP